MDTRTIRFIANRPWLTADSPSCPKPIVGTLPTWFRNADLFQQNPATGQPLTGAHGGKLPSWRGCPALGDVMASGYAYRTPCDIEFFEDAKGDINARVLDARYQDFLQERLPLAQFPHPQGCHWKHFAWWPDWAVELPAGYSALYTHPVNRFELPFLTTSGIVDNDEDLLPSTMPFFFLQGMEGIVPAGTPYAQIFPFKREHWVAEIVTAVTQEQIEAAQQENSAKFRQPDGGVYLREVWARRNYR